jgi:hypothetical protein
MGRNGVHHVEYPDCLRLACNWAGMEFGARGGVAVNGTTILLMLLLHLPSVDDVDASADHIVVADLIILLC